MYISVRNLQVIASLGLYHWSTGSVVYFNGSIDVKSSYV